MLYIIVALSCSACSSPSTSSATLPPPSCFGIQVNEFSIGMGPALLKKQKGDTLYSLRLFPIGGYCAMEGEDEEASSDNPRAFGNAGGWKKVIVLVAGAFMNFLTGLLIVLILYAGAAGFSGPHLRRRHRGLRHRELRPPGGGPHPVRGRPRRPGVRQRPVYLSRAGDDVDFVVERDGERLELNNVHLPYQERTDEEGNYTRLRGISIGYDVDPPTIGNKLLYAWNTAIDYVRLVWISLGDLVTGAVGLRDLSGPVGIVDTMSQVGSASPTAADAAYNLLTLAALIAVNLAVMNLLPLPALDGGRVLFLVLNGILHALFRKKIPAKYEGYVHFVGLAALLTLSLMVAFSDVGKIIGI